ncbi:MAG: aminopeptidase P family protein [Oscillospiraceae bacterium]|nr:aminopeptidase P family protein [Oscillospiraceae bacterium]
MKTERLNRVLQKLDAMGVQQMIVTDPVSIFYLTGYSIEPGERLFALYINSKGENKLYVNWLFHVPQDYGVELVRFTDTDDYVGILGDGVDPSQTLGVDKMMPAKWLLPIIKRFRDTNVEVTSVCVDEVRACKDEEERQLMRIASQINDRAMAEFKKLLVEGVTEKEVAEKMKGIYQSLGGDDLSFSPIVCFGKTSGIGHHEPDDTKLKEGDVIILDVGCRKDGYCADMTRAFFYKKIADPQHKEIYEIIRKAVAAAEAVCRPGVPLWQIDKAARDVIEAAGYGQNFQRRTGHFIGLEVHDYGDVSSKNQNLTQPGNIFSIEPGITIEGEFGLYIEDLVLITEDGCEILNHYPHDLQILE